jgi:hypothetical protein
MHLTIDEAKMMAVQPTFFKFNYITPHGCRSASTAAWSAAGVLLAYKLGHYPPSTRSECFQLLSESSTTGNFPHRFNLFASHATSHRAY